LPVVDRDGRMTGRQMVLYCLTLIVVGLTPALWCGAGSVYHAGALLLGAGFLASALAFAWTPGVERARMVLRASLVYLPGLLAVLLLDVLSRAG